MAKFSVILPVRNGGEYIKACIDSLLSQTFTDFNILVLDNCSTDGTSEWLASLRNDKIVLFPSDKPLDIAGNWHRITTVPKNEFITLIGHADILYPEFLEHINRLMQQYPDAGVFHTHFHFIDAGGEVIRSSKPMPQFLSGDELLKAFLTQSIDSMGTGYVMRSADYDRLGGIPVKYPSLLFADFELWLLLAQDRGIAIAGTTDFAFRVHQSTTGTSSDKRLHEALAVYVKFLSGIAGRSPTKKVIIQRYAAEMLGFYCKGFAHRLLRSPLEKRDMLTVDQFVKQVQILAEQLDVAAMFYPFADRSIKLARLIDSNAISRKLFLWFKNIYSKPIL